MTRKTPEDKLKEWRRGHEKLYAQVLLADPQPTTILKAIPSPGLSLLMGDIGSGKSGLAHEIAWQLYQKKGHPAVIHLPPHAPVQVKEKAKRLLSKYKWIKVTTSLAEWPHGSTVIVDEASQSAHARRGQSGEAIEIDNLLGVCRQRDQTILFIAHQSRKLDIEVIRAVHRIVWKEPTHAHAVFERDELSDFTWKALEFFAKLPTDAARKKAALVVNFKHLGITQLKNGLPPWWTEELSCVFKDLGNGNHNGNRSNMSGVLR